MASFVVFLQVKRLKREDKLEVALAGQCAQPGVLDAKATKVDRRRVLRDGFDAVGAHRVVDRILGPFHHT